MYLFCRPACHLEVAMLVNGSEYVKVGDASSLNTTEILLSFSSVKVGDASILLRKDEVQSNPVSDEFR